MIRNWNIAVLLLSVFTLVVFSYAVLNRAELKETQTITTKSSDSTPTPISKPSLKKQEEPGNLSGSKTDLTVLSKNDIFHPLRGKDDAETEPVKAPPKKTPSRVKFDLRGVFRSGDKYGALLSVNGGGPQNKNELKKADAEVFFSGSQVAEGYTLKTVESQSVTIVGNGEEIIVELEKLKPPAPPDEDKEKPKPDKAPAQKPVAMSKK